MVNFSLEGLVGYFVQETSFHEPGPATDMVHWAYLVFRKFRRQLPTFKNQEIFHKSADLG